MERIVASFEDGRTPLLLARGERFPWGGAACSKAPESAAKLAAQRMRFMVEELFEGREDLASLESEFVSGPDPQVWLTARPHWAVERRDLLVAGERLTELARSACPGLGSGEASDAARRAYLGELRRILDGWLFERGSGDAFVKAALGEELWSRWTSAEEAAEIESALGPGSARDPERGRI